jgi:hypothetical protein
LSAFDRSEVVSQGHVDGVTKRQPENLIAGWATRHASGDRNVLRFRACAANEKREYCHRSRKEKSGKPVENRAFAFGRQLLKNVFDVNTSGNAFSSKAYGECCYHSRKEESAKPVEDRAFAFGGQVLKNVFGVDRAGEALRSLPHHGAQEPLAAFVDERDFVQVDDAGSLVISAVFLFPAGPEFAKPGSSKPSLENPSLF